MRFMRGSDPLTGDPFAVYWASWSMGSRQRSRVQVVVRRRRFGSTHPCIAVVAEDEQSST